jgi:hypothetical protein
MRTHEDSCGSGFYVRLRQSRKVEILEEKYTYRNVQGPDKRQGKKLIRQLEMSRIRNKKGTDQKSVENKIWTTNFFIIKKTQIKNDKNLTNEEDKGLGAREEIYKTTGETKMRQQEGR